MNSSSAHLRLHLRHPRNVSVPHSTLECGYLPVSSTAHFCHGKCPTNPGVYGRIGVFTLLLMDLQAHNHARNALHETRRSNPVAASEEHDLAAAEFATAAHGTSDSEVWSCAEDVQGRLRVHARPSAF